MENVTVAPEKLLTQAEILYRFNVLFSDYENTVRDYGNGTFMSMTEIHMLVHINEFPGITGAELADWFLITASAVSQVLSRLERRGYVVRVAEHGKRKKLYVTLAGKQLCDNHRGFDIRTLAKTYGYLLRDCTPEEIQAFYKVMEVYNNIMTAGRRKRLKTLSTDKLAVQQTNNP